MMTIPWKTDKSLVSKPEFYVRKPREILPRRFVPSHCVQYEHLCRPSVQESPTVYWHSLPTRSYRRTGTTNPACTFPFYLSTSLHHNQLLNLFSSRSTLKTIDLGSITSSSSSPFSSITSVCHHGHLFSPDPESADQLVRHPFAPSYSPVGHITHLFFIS